MGEHAFPLTGFVSMVVHVTNGGNGGIMSTARLELPYPYVSLPKFWDETSQRGRNVTSYGYKYHFYSLAVEAGFYGDCGRVVGTFTKLSNGERG